MYYLEKHFFFYHEHKNFKFSLKYVDNGDSMQDQNFH